MRKVASAALAVPVLVLVYLPLLARRSVAARIGLVASVGVIVLAAAFGLSRPVPTTASAPSAPITALADDAFRSISAATDLRAAIDITFSEAMDPLSVAHSLSVAPANTVELAWNPARTVLTIRPTSHWAAGTYHTLSVAPGALSAAGRPMSSPVRAAFVTRPVTTGRGRRHRCRGCDRAVERVPPDLRSGDRHERRRGRNPTDARRGGDAGGGIFWNRRERRHHLSLPLWFRDHLLVPAQRSACAGNDVSTDRREPRGCGRRSRRC